MFPTQLPNGPKITDNRTTTATVGLPVPIVFGTADVAGTVIWLARYVEHTSNQGGKGGPTQQTFNYTQSIAIGLCERIDDTADDTQGAIAGISRIWENGAIMYDIRPQLEANTDLGTVAETDQQYANRLTASAAYAETFVLHLGTELQTADATIEAIEGFGNVPAFRGLAYIVYPDRALTISQGLRHPSFTFEVVTSGMGNCVSTTQISNQVLYPWAGGSEHNPLNTANNNTFQINIIDNLYPGTGWNGTTIYHSEADMIAALRTAGYPSTVQYVGYIVPPPEGTGQVVQAGGPVVTTGPAGGVDPAFITMKYNNMVADQGYFATVPAANTAGNIPFGTVHIGSDSRMYYNTGSTDPISPPLDYPRFTQIAGVFTGGYWVEFVVDANVFVTRFPAGPPDPCSSLPPSTFPGFGVRPDGSLVKCGPWTEVIAAPDSVKVLQQYGGAETQCVYPLSPCVLIGDPHFNDSAFWTAAYADAVASGYMTAGKVYGVDYPFLQDYYFTLDLVVCEASSEKVTISTIIKAICKRSGLDASQIDASDMDGITINGYSVSSVCNGSSILSPLRSVAFFDAVESGGVLKFPMRGKPIVATLTNDDIGCFDGGGTSTPPPAVTNDRADETTLPRSIRYHYKAVSRDYQDAEADSPFRLTTSAVDDQDISVPMVLGDVQAAKAAEIVWSDAWAAQNSHELSVDQAWSELEPSDCIGVPIDGVIQRIRIVSDQNAAGVLRKLSCVRDNEGAYISFAVATPPEHKPGVLKLLAQSSAEYLDLPALQDADNDAGFYIAAQRQNGVGNDWKGATIYKSVDGGLTFSPIFSIITEAVIGSLTSAVPPSEAFTWDTTTVINVTVASAIFTFESRTDAAVLAGANAAAMGANGRWEIVQFADAVKIDDTHWQLSRLLRGRRGTEHVIGTSREGDTFVLISTGDLGRMPLQQSEIGANRVYKVVSIGASFTSGINTTFAGHAQALVPFSPVDLTAVRQTDDDILLSWIRRGRIGRTLMSGIDVPLSEATEAYQVDILDESSSPEVVKRTLTASTQHVVYTAAQQIADFGSGSPLTTVKVAIYQMSAVVGRGTPAIEILNIG